MKPVNPSDWVDAFLSRRERERKVGVYHPSEVGHCLRELYFAYTEPRPWPKEKLRLFRAGDLVHEFVREVLANTSGIRLLGWEREFVIPCGGFDIAGRADDLITIKVEDYELGLPVDVPLLVEVKSLGTPRFPIDSPPEGLEHLQAPFPEHVLQITPYMRAFHLDYGLIWYFRRDNLADRYFCVQYKPELFSQVVLRFAELHDWLTVKKCPPPPEAKHNPDKKWRCRFCLYQDKCS
jgi:hypothetical protein